MNILDYVKLTPFQYKLYTKWISELPSKEGIHSDEPECCVGTGSTVTIEITPSGIGDSFIFSKRVGNKKYSIDLNEWDDGTIGFTQIEDINYG